MTSYRVIAEETAPFDHSFDGELQINLTFEHEDTVYRLVTRAHDEDANTPTLHAQVI